MCKCTFNATMLTCNYKPLSTKRFTKSCYQWYTYQLLHFWKIGIQLRAPWLATPPQGSHCLPPSPSTNMHNASYWIFLCTHLHQYRPTFDCPIDPSCGTFPQRQHLLPTKQQAEELSYIDIPHSPPADKNAKSLGVLTHVYSYHLSLEFFPSSLTELKFQISHHSKATFMSSKLKVLFLEEVVPFAIMILQEDLPLLTARKTSKAFHLTATGRKVAVCVNKRP